MPPVRLLLFSASLRHASLNSKLAKLVGDHARERGAIVDFASMHDFDCPSYDGDLETSQGIPAGAQALRDRLLANNAFVIVSPEYNVGVTIASWW